MDKPTPKKQKSPKVTYKDIAAKARLSRTTISMAFRNDPSIPKETRAKVFKVAEQLGYYPDPKLNQVMAYMRKCRTHNFVETLGVINFWPEVKPVSRAFKIFLEGAELKAKALGYKLELFHFGDSAMTSKRMSQILISRKVRGLLLPPSPYPTKSIDLDWDKFATVASTHLFDSLGLDTVRHDESMAISIVWDELKHRGYKRIGLASTSVHKHRRAGIDLATYLLRQHDSFDHESIPVLITPPDDVSGVLEWIKQHQPDAIITESYEIVKTIRKAKIKIPQKIAIAHTNVVNTRKSLAGIAQSFELIGEACVEILAGKLAINQFGKPLRPRVTLTEVSWKEGDSIRKASVVSAKFVSK